MAKARLYKMVNPGKMSRGGITVKVGDKVVTQPTINFSKNISAINSLGATVNSIAVVTESLKDSFQEYSLKSMSDMQGLLDKRKDHLDAEKKIRDDAAKDAKTLAGKQADEASEGKQEKKSVLKQSVPVMKKIAKSAFGFLSKIGTFFADIISKFISYQVLNWMSNPNSVKKMESLIKGVGHMIKFFGKVAGFVVSFGLAAFKMQMNLYKKIFQFAKFMIGLGMFFSPVNLVKMGISGAKGVLDKFKNGSLMKTLKSFLTGIGGMINGLVAVISGLGFGKFLQGGGGDVSKELEKPEEESGTKNDSVVEAGQVTGGSMTQEQAQASIRYADLEEMMSEALENNDMKLYEQLEKEQAALPQFAKGGWIKGPMSGYPVSLDGGRSTSFIGHGTEYVAPKMAVGGGPLGQAFVIPYDTPATRTNPGLTNTRLLQAKSAGFNVAPMAGGGLLEAIGNTIATPRIPYKEINSKIGADKKTWDTFRNTIADIESSGKYRVFGGNNDMYDGRYQMGSLAKTDGARMMGMRDPGHDEDPKKYMRVMFRNNKALQERLFAGFTIANHNYLSSVKEYADADLLRKMEILAYAHNQGWQGAKIHITQGKVGQDSFGTKGTEYSDRIKSAFQEANISPVFNDNTTNNITNTNIQQLSSAQGQTTGDTINNNALNDVESSESAMQVIAGDLNPIDTTSPAPAPPPIVTGGGKPYEIPANDYIKPRFGLLADIASKPVEIL